MKIETYLEKLNANGFKSGNCVYDVNSNENGFATRIAIYPIFDEKGTFLTNFWFKKDPKGLSVAIETTSGAVRQNIELLRSILSPNKN